MGCLFDVEFNDCFEALEQGLQDEIWAYIDYWGGLVRT